MPFGLAWGTATDTDATEPETGERTLDEDATGDDATLAVPADGGAKERSAWPTGIRTLDAAAPDDAGD